MKQVYVPTIVEVQGEEAWSALEQDLLACCRTGEWAELHGRTGLPDEDDDDPDRRVRASLIRYLMLGGCDSDNPAGYRPHPKGVRLSGARIVGPLDLEGCISQRDLALSNCRFPDPINLQDAEIGGLMLQGCHAAHTVDLHRLKTETDVMLRNSFHAAAGVDLGGAEIGGNLDCTNGTFLNPTGKAINANGAQAGGSVFLRGSKITGLIDFVRVSVTGNMHFGRAKVDGVVHLGAAQIGGGAVLERRGPRQPCARTSPDRGAGRCVA